MEVGEGLQSMCACVYNTCSEGVCVYNLGSWGWGMYNAGSEGVCVPHSWYGGVYSKGVCVHVYNTGGEGVYVHVCNAGSVHTYISSEGVYSTGCGGWVSIQRWWGGYARVCTTLAVKGAVCMYNANGGRGGVSACEQRWQWGSTYDCKYTAPLRRAVTDPLPRCVLLRTRSA